MAFIFYDVETTGTAATFDQILQLAAIRTDDALNVTDSLNIRCRLLPYVVPSPEALLVTGVTASDLGSAPFSHFEMMRQIHTKMAEWSAEGAIFVGWNSMRFDEGMLRQGYYQSLLPIYQTNTNGNGRADMMRMAQVASACMPSCLAIPRDSKGKCVFKLGGIAEANGVQLDNAHEAMSDAAAVLGIARLVKQSTPKLWDAMVTNARKAAALKLIKNHSHLVLSETYWGAPYTFIVAPVVANAANANEWALFDLQFDPEPLLNANDADLLDAIDGKTKKIRRVSVNSQPALLPLEFAPVEIRGGRLSITTYQARAKAVLEHTEFRRRIGFLLSERYADEQPSSYVEENIYASFATSADEIRMHNFQRSEWSDRKAIIKSLGDERFREFGRRILACERSDLLTEREAQQWRGWCRDRLLSDSGVPWLTVSAARARVKELKDTWPDRHEFLSLLDRFLENMCPETLTVA
ncbi:exonuclease domain-containing protein [Bradyrhizobium sp. SZCCHNR1039]|uniref:exonuclease domain-containing protein n=1 Tax=Bradyrhizobium sp. SZCCHNR1039 TaxID=3057350 RepID=UPI002916277F|nr:exonuclease domain-containing protein [Bradyrhizobium sp. SZCCHNR1039]